MNIMSLLAALFGTIAVILLYALSVARDEARQMRQINMDLVKCGNEAIAYIDALEARNSWLESKWTYSREAVGMSIAQSRVPERDRTMAVERMEYLCDYHR